MASYARSIALTGSDQAASTAAGSYRGVALWNSHATNGSTVTLYDNASAASGTVIDAFTLAAGTSASVLHDGIWCVNGIYVDIGGTGTVVGSVRIG